MLGIRTLELFCRNKFSEAQSSLSEGGMFRELGPGYVKTSLLISLCTRAAKSTDLPVEDVAC
jgi:hypothetical protein